MEILSETFLAHVASCMDCDGSLMITGPGNYWRARARATFTNADEKVPYLLKKVFGGGVRHYKSPSGRPMHKWYATGKATRRLVTAIMPFMTIKKDQALCMLDFWEAQDVHTKARHGRAAGHGSMPYTRNERYDLLTYVTRIAELH